MKQKVSTPMALGVIIVLLGGIGFFMYTRYFAGPPIDKKPTGPSAMGMQRPTNFNAMTVNDKKKLYGMGRPGQ